MKECYLCGKVGVTERHHVYSGSYRKTADRLGLVIDLCPECHRFIHSGKGAETKQQIQTDIQFQYMERNGWTKEQWLSQFGKSWI